jgi:hypothetical protein
MSVTTVLLLCREGQSREVYQSELDSDRTLMICVQTLEQFFRRELYCPLNGILVDMPTYMRSTEIEKLLLTELVELFPALRVKCNESSGEIRTLPFGLSYPRNIALAEFAQTYCAAFAARKIRSSERSSQHLPVLLNRSSAASGDAGIRSVTANICCRGCFLISFEPWNVKERGWLTIPELQSSAPIEVEVCWVRPWGDHHTLPGMGVRFVDLSIAAGIELSCFGGKSFMLEDQ